MSYPFLVLQCLSNTVSLTNYFLAKHINTTSNLGSGEAIADAYGTLIEELWSGKGSVISPKHFLVSIIIYSIIVNLSYRSRFAAMLHN